MQHTYTHTLSPTVFHSVIALLCVWEEWAIIERVFRKVPPVCTTRTEASHCSSNWNSLPSIHIEFTRLECTAFQRILGSMPPGVHLASLRSVARRRGGPCSGLLTSSVHLRKWLVFTGDGPRASTLHFALPSASANTDGSGVWSVNEEPSDGAPFVEDVTEEYAYPDQIIQQSAIARANNALRKVVGESNIAAAEVLLGEMNPKGRQVEQNVVFENVTTYCLK